MPLYAKRKDDRIVCGVSGCGAELARVDRIKGWEDVVFEEGWQPRSDGVWAITRRARRIAEQNRRMHAAGERPFPVERRPRPMVRGTLGIDIKLPIGSGWVSPPLLPIDCICPMPKCGMRQTLDRARLALRAGFGEELKPLNAEILDPIATDRLAGGAAMDTARKAAIASPSPSSYFGRGALISR